MDIKTLKALEPTEYAEAADGYRAVSDAADASRERIDKQITKAMDAANEGKAADAAQKQLKKLSENLHYTQVECGLVSGSLNGFSTEIASPRLRLTEALDDAAALGYPVSATGDVTFPAGGENKLTGDPAPGGTAVGNNGMLGPSNRSLYGPGPNGLYSPGGKTSGIDIHHGNPHFAKAQDIADRIAHALREATEIDERYSEALGKLKAAPGLSVGTKTWADVASDVGVVSTAAGEYLRDAIPLDKSPADRKEWWDSLTDEEREEFRIAFPEVIGNLDGIPAVVRDEANRENLPLLIASLEGHHDETSQAAGGSPGNPGEARETQRAADVPPGHRARRKRQGNRGLRESGHLEECFGLCSGLGYQARLRIRRRHGQACLLHGYGCSEVRSLLVRNRLARL